jgi:hypothetical protein
LVVVARASYHNLPWMAATLGSINCGLLVLGPYDSAANAIEYVHWMIQCYLRRDVAFARAMPMSAMLCAGALVQPAHCDNIIEHTLSR